MSGEQKLNRRFPGREDFGRAGMRIMPFATGVWQDPTNRLDPSTSTTQMRRTARNKITVMAERGMFTPAFSAA